MYKRNMEVLPVDSIEISYLVDLENLFSYDVVSNCMGLQWLDSSPDIPPLTLDLDLAPYLGNRFKSY